MLYYHVTLSSKGDLQFPCAAAVRCVSVHRPPSESAEEHDVLHPVLLRYGSHVLHPLHVHGEPTSTQTATLHTVHLNRLQWEHALTLFTKLDNHNAKMHEVELPMQKMKGFY